MSVSALMPDQGLQPVRIDNENSPYNSAGGSMGILEFRKRQVKGMLLFTRTKRAF